jgi:hypothetical protein
MKEMVLASLSSVKSKMDPMTRQHCFEIFGYDFMIDNSYNSWLIEVNTNPCLDESSALLKSYLPRMVDDAFRLTLDHIFPPRRIRNPQAKTDKLKLLATTKTQNLHNTTATPSPIKKEDTTNSINANPYPLPITISPNPITNTDIEELLKIDNCAFLYEKDKNDIDLADLICESKI